MLSRFFQFLPPLSFCLFFRVTGFYCPGCGGTRACMSLLSGHPVQSFIYHPFVLYSAACLLYYAVRFLYYGITKKGRPVFRPVLLWIALGIVGFNWILKNALLLCGIDLMEVAASLSF